ncbi:MAG: 2-oxoacid:acceptor oxidoreductase family protein [Thermoplasmata archaeon]
MTTFQEIRWHGRGGQGVVTASRLLASAALTEMKYVQAFPEFGPERSGAPILGFTRISDSPIEVHSQIYSPDIVVVLDPTLMNSEVTRGMKERGKLVVNSPMSPGEIKKIAARGDIHVYSVDGTRIAIDTTGRPIANIAMLGALVRATSLVSIQSLMKVTSERFGGSAASRNIKAIERAAEEVRGE